METFNDLVEKAILSELSLTNLAHRVNRKIDDKFGSHAANKMMARAGSKSAQGRVNFKQQFHGLVDAWRTYLAEQGIGKPLLDDVLDFLKYRVNFQAPDELMATLAYGPAAKTKSSHEADIESVLHQLQSAIETRQPIEPALFDSLKSYAEADDASEIAVRRGLFSLARNNQGSARQLAPVAKLIGGKSINDEMLSNLFTKVARLILKTKNSMSRPHPVNPTVGSAATNKAADIGLTTQQYAEQKPGEQSPFIADIEALGFDETALQQTVRYRKNPEVLAQNIKKKLPVDKACRLIDILLHRYVGKALNKLDGVFSAMQKSDPQIKDRMKAFQDQMQKPYSKRAIDGAMKQYLLGLGGDNPEMNIYGFVAALLISTGIDIGAQA